MFVLLKSMHEWVGVSQNLGRNLTINLLNPGNVWQRAWARLWGIPHFFKYYNCPLCSPCTWPKEVSFSPGPSIFLFPSCAWALGVHLHLPTGGHKSEEGVLLHLPSSSCCAARQSSETPVKWTPSLIRDGPTHKQGSTHSVTAVHNHLSMHWATFPFHCRSKVIGW